MAEAEPDHVGCDADTAAVEGPGRFPELDRGFAWGCGECLAGPEAQRDAPPSAASRTRAGRRPGDGSAIDDRPRQRGRGGSFPG